MSSPTLKRTEYAKGYNDGLEAAALHCEYAKRLALSVIETNCYPEAVAFQFRADDIRKMKVTIG